MSSEFEQLLDVEMRVARSRFRSRVGRLVAATLIWDLVAAVLAYEFEKSSPHAFRSVWSALFWTTTQLLTVSSSLPNPESTPGKWLDVGLELWALVIVASLAGTFADVLHHRTRKHVHAAMKSQG